jgi:hypothetical protein
MKPNNRLGSWRRNRKQRRASGVYKLEALFHDAERDALVVKDNTYYIDGRLSDYLVVSVPESTTRASAINLEHELSKLAKKPVLIVTHNMSFLRATLLTAKEKAELTEIIEKSTKGTTSDAPSEQGEEASA